VRQPCEAAHLHRCAVMPSTTTTPS